MLSEFSNVFPCFIAPSGHKRCMSDGDPKFPEVRLDFWVSNFKPLRKIFPADDGSVSAQNVEWDKSLNGLNK